jgi:hypothetical protein
VGARLCGFVVEKLTAEVIAEGGVLYARVAGTATQRDVAPLEELFARMVEACVGGEVREVVVDLRDLEYLNSAHFKTLVSWVGRMGGLGRRVGVRLRANEKYHWQQRSLHALQHLAESFVTVE